MTWEERFYIKERSDKQLKSIDNLIQNKKYDLARREAYKFLGRYPGFLELNNRIILLNHILGYDQENVCYLNNVLEGNNKSSVKASLFECYYYIRDYRKAFDLLDDFMESAKESKLKDYRLYEIVIMKQLGMDIHLLDFEKNSYVLNQIIDYQKDSFYNHLKQSMMYLQKSFISINPNVDFKVLEQQIINDLDSYQRSKFIRALDTYYFRYDNFATDIRDNSSINYIRVKFAPATNNIIYIDPVPDDFPDVYNELAQKNEEYHSPYQLKRKTQIDKFHSRYKK